MRKILVVVDMQNDFIDGALGTPEAVAIVENVKARIREYDPADIFVTMDTHAPNYLETQEGRNLPVEHCIEGTDGWQLWEGLEVPGAIIIDKPSFGYTKWADYKLEEVEMIGLCTDICVVSNALIIKALFPEIKVTVDASCCAGVTPESHAAALTTMKMCQVEVIGE